jgi:hypothetical protein
MMARQSTPDPTLGRIPPCLLVELTGTVAGAMRTKAHGQAFGQLTVR